MTGLNFGATEESLGQSGNADYCWKFATLTYSHLVGYKLVSVR